MNKSSRSKSAERNASRFFVNGYKDSEPSSLPKWKMLFISLVIIVACNCKANWVLLGTSGMFVCLLLKMQRLTWCQYMPGATDLGMLGQED